MGNNNLTNLMINYNYYKANGLRFPDNMKEELNLNIFWIYLKQDVFGEIPYINDFEQFKKSYLGE